MFTTAQKKPDSLWVGSVRTDPGVRLRLFCFPYGGGGASVFRGWQEALPPDVDVCPIQLPGREGRIRESCFTDVRALVACMAPEIVPFLDRSFAFFGHSMGALISFELCRYLRAAYSIAPQGLFVSAYPAPRVRDSENAWYDLPEPEFLERMKRLGGTPGEVLDHPELMQLMLPLLRADVEMVQTYVYSDAPLLSVPITAFAGLNDPEVPLSDVERWREETTSRFALHTIPGDHFFVHSERAVLLEQLASALAALTAQISIKGTKDAK